MMVITMCKIAMASVGARSAPSAESRAVGLAQGSLALVMLRYKLSPSLGRGSLSFGLLPSTKACTLVRCASMKVDWVGHPEQV